MNRATYSRSSYINPSVARHTSRDNKSIDPFKQSINFIEELSKQYSKNIPLEQSDILFKNYIDAADTGLIDCDFNALCQHFYEKGRFHKSSATLG